MRTTTILAAVGLSLAAIGLTSTVSASDDTSWHRYWTTGGTSPCVAPGSSDDLHYAALQLTYLGHDTARPCPNPVTVAPTTATPCEEIELAGGNFCFVPGTPEHARAVADAAEYKDWVDENLDPGTTTAPPTTEPPPLEVIVILADGSVMSTTTTTTPPVEPAPVRPTTRITLPETS